METLKDIERKGSKMASAAATNLSFIYFLVRACPLWVGHAPLWEGLSIVSGQSPQPPLLSSPDLWPQRKATVHWLSGTLTRQLRRTSTTLMVRHSVVELSHHTNHVLVSVLLVFVCTPSLPHPLSHGQQREHSLCDPAV